MANDHILHTVIVLNISLCFNMEQVGKGAYGVVGVDTKESTEDGLIGRGQ